MSKLALLKEFWIQIIIKWSQYSIVPKCTSFRVRRNSVGSQLCHYVNRTNHLNILDLSFLIYTMRIIIILIPTLLNCCELACYTFCKGLNKHSPLHIVRILGCLASISIKCHVSLLIHQVMKNMIYPFHFDSVWKNSNIFKEFSHVVIQTFN